MIRAMILIALLWALDAQAEGVQVSGKRPDCPMGQALVRVSINDRVVAELCMAAAELERAGYRVIVGDMGEIVCRVLVVRMEK
jgi:hypothetical protein